MYEVLSVKDQIEVSNMENRGWVIVLTITFRLHRFYVRICICLPLLLVIVFEALLDTSSIVRS